MQQDDKPVRMILHIDDIMKITGFSERQSRRISLKIRQRYSKGHVTAEDFSQHMGIKLVLVMEFLGRKDK